MHCLEWQEKKLAYQIWLQDIFLMLEVNKHGDPLTHWPLRHNMSELLSLHKTKVNNSKKRSQDILESKNSHRLAPGVFIST